MAHAAWLYFVNQRDCDKITSQCAKYCSSNNRACEYGPRVGLQKTQ